MGAGFTAFGRRVARLACAGWLAAAAVCAQAQVPLPPAADPGAIQRRSIEDERRIREETERLPAKPDRPVDTDQLKPAPKPPEGEVRFLVREIEFSPSEVLSREELAALAAPYRGRQVSLNELRRLVEEVNALYRSKGVVTAQAILPPQDVTDGVVRIRLVEGRIGKVSVEGNATTSADYVAGFVHRAPGELVDVPSLERDLGRFNRSNDAKVRAELKPGAGFGETDILLKLAEPPRHSLRLFTDSQGSKPTGELRYGAIYQYRSLLGRRDDVVLSWSGAEGVDSRSAQYGFPINTWGGRLQLGYFDDRTKIKNGALAPLDVTGESTAVVGTLRHLVWFDRSTQIDALLGAKNRVVKNFASGIQLQRTEVTDGSAGAEVTSLDSSGAWQGNLVFSHGSAEVEGVSGRQTYSVWRAAVNRVQRLSDAFSLRASVAGQASPDDLLPSSEQFFIGGDGTVRGYPTAIRAGDEGYVASVEVHRAVHVPDIGEASVFGFVDYGRVYPFRPPGAQGGSDRLTGAGVGVNFTIGRWLYGRVVAGFPLTSIPDEDRTVRIHFQLVATPF